MHVSYCFHAESSSLAPMNTVKISANLPAATIEQLKKIAEQQGITMTEALRQAISTKSFLNEQSAKGAKILVEEKDKSLKQVVWH
jgi:hypothetical protein